VFTSRSSNLSRKLSSSQQEHTGLHTVVRGDSGWGQGFPKPVSSDLADIRHSGPGSGLGFQEMGRGSAKAEDAQGTPIQSHISPSILVYDEKNRNLLVVACWLGSGTSSNVQRFRGGLVFKAHRLCVSLNPRLEINTEEKVPRAKEAVAACLALCRSPLFTAPKTTPRTAHIFLTCQTNIDPWQRGLKTAIEFCVELEFEGGVGV